MLTILPDPFSTKCGSTVFIPKFSLAGSYSEKLLSCDTFKQTSFSKIETERNLTKKAAHVTPGEHNRFENKTDLCPFSNHNNEPDGVFLCRRENRPRVRVAAAARRHPLYRGGTTHGSFRAAVSKKTSKAGGGLAEDGRCRCGADRRRHGSDLFESPHDYRRGVRDFNVYEPASRRHFRYAPDGGALPEISVVGGLYRLYRRIYYDGRPS